MQCIPEDGRSRIVFVDTPPFPNPDERMKDAEKAVEKKIGDWLKKA
jgi:GTPase Era involved in 16S rRNA processing